MAVKCAVMCLQSVEKSWIAALDQAQRQGIIQIVAAHHINIDQARELAVPLDAPFYDDERRMMIETSPQMLVIDRPEQLRLDFLESCIRQQIGILSLGPPIGTIDEAQRLAKILEPTTQLLHIVPNFGNTWAFHQSIQTEDFFRSISFIDARWYAPNHAAARAGNVSADQPIVRSLSVLAWDAARTILELVGMPESIYAAIDGTTGAGDHFIDATGSTAVTMRFAGGGSASVALSDRDFTARRQMLILSHSGSVSISEYHYHFADTHGSQVDTDSKPAESPTQQALRAIEDFARQLQAPPSPHRGHPHRLLETAAMMVAMIVSNRTGGAESPQAMLNIRR